VDLLNNNLILGKSNLKNSNNYSAKRKYMISNLEIFHKIFDCLNISILFLIFLLSLIAFNSQKKWTKLHSNLEEFIYINNNLIDYISKTEEYFLQQIEFKDHIRTANSKDLIYFEKSNKDIKINFLTEILNDLRKGLQDSKFQKGY
tara:strand:- start:1147 stop:1584 length:438 start_codon:yes stop_codon:yes gene_type:complete